MSPFETYKEYISLKNHFTKNDYDYFKYNGKSRVTLDSFNKRKDKIFFEKLSKRSDVHGYLVANLSDNPKHWIRDLAYSEDAERTYNDWLKRNQSLTYNYKSDFIKILEEQSREEGHHPSALRLYLGKHISLESLCVFVNMTNALITWNSKLEYDPIWEDVRLKVVKYTPFVKFEHSKIKKVMIDILNDMGYTK